MPQPQPRESIDDDGSYDDGTDGGFGPEDLRPRVNVSDKCVPSSFGIGMMFMAVAAQGGQNAGFSVVASFLGKVGVFGSGSVLVLVPIISLLF